MAVGREQQKQQQEQQLERARVAEEAAKHLKEKLKSRPVVVNERLFPTCKAAESMPSKSEVQPDIITNAIVFTANCTSADKSAIFVDEGCLPLPRRLEFALIACCYAMRLPVCARSLLGATASGHHVLSCILTSMSKAGYSPYNISKLLSCHYLMLASLVVHRR